MVGFAPKVTALIRDGFVVKLVITDYGCGYDGDFDSNSIINIFDVIFLVNCVILNDCGICGDINIDGSIDILDIIHLVNLILNS